MMPSYRKDYFDHVDLVYTGGVSTDYILPDQTDCQFTDDLLLIQSTQQLSNRNHVGDSKRHDLDKNNVCTTKVIKS